MIASGTAVEIRRLLADGTLSQRKIAKLIGVSRGTIGAIASGKRPDYDALRLARRTEAEEQPLGPPERCPSCGGRVYMPCRLCKAHEQISQLVPSLHRRKTHFEETLHLDLRPDHRKRYEEVCAMRQALANQF